MPSSMSAWQEVLWSNFGFSWKPSVMFPLGQRAGSVVRFPPSLQWTGMVAWGGGMEQWTSDLERRWRSPQRALHSQKRFCSGEERGASPVEQATGGGSRGEACSGLLTCGFNYPVSHCFTVIQV